MVGIILFNRKGDPPPETINQSVFIIKEEIEDISSTIIRTKVKNKDSLQGLVPQNVYDYIYTNNLYNS